MIRSMQVCGLGLGLLVVAGSVEGQHGSMSDVTGTTPGLISRVMTIASPAPPAPPPRFVVTPAILDTLCVTRADALLTLAILTEASRAEAETRALILLRGGALADEHGAATRAALVRAGAEAGAAAAFVEAMTGLLSASPEPPDLAMAVVAHNTLVRTAEPVFLLALPEDFLALRDALRRLIASAHAAAATGLSDPGILTDVQYANDASWLLLGVPLELPTGHYVQFGTMTAVGERRFETVAMYEGVSILAEAPADPEPATVYVPVLGYCDVLLQPYVYLPPVIKLD